MAVRFWRGLKTNYFFQVFVAIMATLMLFFSAVSVSGDFSSGQLRTSNWHVLQDSQKRKKKFKRGTFGHWKLIQIIHRVLSIVKSMYEKNWKKQQLVAPLEIHTGSIWGKYLEKISAVGRYFEWFIFIFVYFIFASCDDTRIISNIKRKSKASL